MPVIRRRDEFADSSLLLSTRSARQSPHRVYTPLIESDMSVSPLRQEGWRAPGTLVAHREQSFRRQASQSQERHMRNWFDKDRRSFSASAN